MSKVVLYSSNCPRCKVLENKLNAKGIEFEVFSDVDAMVAKGFKAAPMLEVDGEVFAFADAVKWVGEQ